MTVTDQTEGHQARCLPHLLVLRMLTSDHVEVPGPWLAMDKVAQATDAILSEVESASLEARAVAGGGPGPGIFLSVRLTRLAAAAGDAVAAAGAGDFAQLRRHLRRFEALTSAIWAVQDVSR
jgi:hypothetical protein